MQVFREKTAGIIAVCKSCGRRGFISKPKGSILLESAPLFFSRPEDLRMSCNVTDVELRRLLC